MYKDSDLKESYVELMDKLKKLSFELNFKKESVFKRIAVNIFTLRINRFIDYFKFKYRTSKLKRTQRYTEKTYIPDINPNYFSEKKFVVYTCIFGKYDNIHEPLFVPDNCEFRLITDLDIDLSNSVWKKVDISVFQKELDGMNNTMKNRYFKFHPDKIFNDVEYSIYIDGNIKVVTDLTEYINKLNSVGFIAHEHRFRSDVYDEIEACLIFKKGNLSKIKEYANFLKEENMPRNYGLIECNVLVREHFNPKCQKIMKNWWKEMEHGTERDQITLPYVLYKMNIIVSEITVIGQNVYQNKSFRILNHK